MPEYVKNANQRLKILYLYKILLERTDEEHAITMPELILQLSRYGINAGRKALYEDIEALRLFGLDIVSERGAGAGYRVVNREFQLPELKLLADAVSSSRFLTEKKSAELLKKLETLTSIYEAKQIQRQVYIADRVKSLNERIYLNIDAIHRAIAEGRMIAFRYFDYGLDRTRHYREGQRTCSPYALTWDDDRYYLVAYYEKYASVSHFRVDRMEDVTLLDKPAMPYPRDFRLSTYLNATFSMFSGDAEPVKLRFTLDLINPVRDRFGQEVWLAPDGDQHFTIRVSIKTQRPEPFFGWLLQFGTRAEILAPPHLRQQYCQLLTAVAQQYTPTTPDPTTT